MTMPTLQTTLSGDNLIGHTVTAASLGGAFSAITVWLLQVVHLVPPASVDQGITVISMVLASLVMQKISG